MKVAGLQLDIAWEAPATNYRRARRLAARAAAGGARLVVLPEMFATGFSMAADRVSRHAEDTRAVLAEVATTHGLWMLGGYAEPGADRPRNAAALFAPDASESLRYRKIHPFSLGGENRVFAGGTSLGTADVEGVRVTPLICYDLRFPEPFRIAAADTDLFVVIANWPAARRDAWRTLLRARAIENQVYVLGVNRVGEGDGLLYAGDSALVDPLGETIASAPRRAAVVIGDVDPARVAAVRARYSFLADRRPEVYAAIERERGAKR
jgi:predicted amidohydrolase